MARPRQFDDDVVMNRVADLFTTHGFTGTSMSMLTEATGMGKQSLYNAFGDKEALYLQAVDFASARFGASLQGVHRAATGRAMVDEFFSVLITACMSANPAENNCILSSGLLEGIDGELVPDKLSTLWQGNQKFLVRLVQVGQRDGSIRKDLTSTELADVLMTLMSGLRVSARAIKQKTKLKTVMSNCLEVLQPIRGNLKGAERSNTEPI